MLKVCERCGQGFNTDTDLRRFCYEDKCVRKRASAAVLKSIAKRKCRVTASPESPEMGQPMVVVVNNV